MAEFQPDPFARTPRFLGDTTLTINIHDIAQNINQIRTRTMRSELFREFLNFFWLRPENALLLAMRAEVYRSTLGSFKDRSLDVSCGDGIFSFITFGGKLSKRTDMFRSLDLSQKRTGQFDAFDAFDDEYLIEISKTPDRYYLFGTDWKTNLLRKAAKLDFYNELIQHDNNYPLPFADSSLDYVYSNSSYWINNFADHLSDLARITDTKGKIILNVKTSEIFRFKSEQYLPFMGSRFHEIIDAGRAETWKGLRQREDLLNIIDKIPHTQIISVEPIYGDLMAIIWDIGLRPLFRPLAKMANNLSVTDRVDIKEEWCDIFVELFEDILEN